MQSDAAPPPAIPPASRTPEQMKAYSAAKAVAAVGGGPAPNSTGLSTGGGQETGGGVGLGCSFGPGWVGAWG